MKIDEALADLQTSILAVASKSMQLEARCDALEVAVRVLAKRAGVDDSKVAKLIQDVTALRHQESLERAEDVSPRLAAQVDTRPSLPDIPDDFV